MTHRKGKTMFNPIYAIAYVINLVYNIVKAVILVAIQCLSGNIDPVVMEVPTELKREISQVILGNSITLTPGTLTLDIDKEKQVLIVAVISPRKPEDVIPFETFIKGMLEG
ncbi:MAG: Na+/H+ antiporter subunit E [Candidatus Methanofastidiosia archaeon]|jgi:energy-converting hydrogenase B subunit A